MTATSIPISQVVTIDPSVVGTGGNPLALNCVLLTENAPASASQLLQYTASQGADAVLAQFGEGPEYTFALGYFKAFDTSTTIPAILFIGLYAAAATPANVVGASLAGVTLTELQQITGTLTVDVNGTAYTDNAVNLAAATSFTNAATLLTTGLSLSTAGAVTWNPLTSTFEIASTQTGSTATITVPTGTASAALGFTTAAILSSPGVAADTPAVAMARVSGQSLNFASFTTAFAPSQAQMTGFAQWVNGQNDDYEYINWDSDVGYATPNNTETWGFQAAALAYDGVSVIGLGTLAQAAAIAGGIAAMNWNTVGGRTNIAFRTQDGLAVSVTDPGVAAAVLTNGAFYYGVYGARGQGNLYNIFYNGQVPGKWKFLDTYVAQLFMNSQFQLAIFTGLMSVNTAPYNAVGASYIRSWMADPITQAVLNGTIVAGVTLSSQQITAIAAQAGQDISKVLFNQGWYLQIGVATAQVRGARQSPPINFWYCDGGSIQSINVPSIAVL